MKVTPADLDKEYASPREMAGRLAWIMMNTTSMDDGCGNPQREVPVLVVDRGALRAIIRDYLGLKSPEDGGLV